MCVFMYRATSKQIEKCFQIVVDDIFTTYSQVSDRSFFLGLLYKDMHTHIYTVYRYIRTKRCIIDYSGMQSM